MKRHLTAPEVTIGRRNGGAVSRIASRQSTAANVGARARPAAREQKATLASVTVHTHTLGLTGELHRLSAYALEAEIERLCDEGVTAITLDLRELDYIDATGIAVIAFRARLCKRRGYEFAVIPGSRFMHRALAQAGVSDLLPFEDSELERSAAHA